MVSIIILSYNTKHQLQECLDSLFLHLKATEKEVIVVDNASKDDSVSFIKKEYPHVHIIENSENVGFAKGCNIGAKKAKGEYLLFLNSDTKFQENSLEKLLAVFKTDSHIGIVGGNLINTDGTYQESFGNFHTIPTLFATLFFGDTYQKKVDIEEKGRLVDWVTGAYMLVQKSAFDEVNGFDEGYFMYIEDMDLCFRIQKKGYKVYFQPSATIEHKGQGSSNRSFAIIHIYRGILHFYKKRRSFVEYMVVYSMLWVKACIAIGIGTITQNKNLTDTYRQALKF